MLFCKKSEEKRVSMLSDTSDSSPFGHFAISQPDQPHLKVVEILRLSRSVTFPRQNDVNVRLRNVVGNNNTSIVIYTEFIKFCINPSSPLFNTLLFYSWIQNDKPFDKSNRCKILLRSDHIMILVAN